MSAIVIDLLAEWVLTIEDEHGVSHDVKDWEHLGMGTYLKRAGVTWKQVDKRANKLHDKRRYRGAQKRAELPFTSSMGGGWMGVPTTSMVTVRGIASASEYVEWEPASGATGGIVVGGECPPGYVRSEFIL